MLIPSLRLSRISSTRAIWRTATSWFNLLHSVPLHLRRQVLKKPSCQIAVLTIPREMDKWRFHLCSGVFLTSKFKVHLNKQTHTHRAHLEHLGLAARNLGNRRDLLRHVWCKTVDWRGPVDTIPADVYCQFTPLIWAPVSGLNLLSTAATLPPNWTHTTQKNMSSTLQMWVLEGIPPQSQGGQLHLCKLMEVHTWEQTFTWEAEKRKKRMKLHVVKIRLNLLYIVRKAAQKWSRDAVRLVNK